MENNQIAKIETTTMSEPITITNDDIKNLFCPLATPKEVAMALGVVKSLGLNPFLREVHFIKYSQTDKLAIVVGYEVYIRRAERSGKLNGWKVGIDKDKGVAWVEIRRKDWAEPFYWEVALSEFDKKQSTWKQIPSFMAKKVAIAQGFRLCFPEDLGSMPYTPEEQEVFDIVSEPVKSTKPVVAMPQEVDEKEAIDKAEGVEREKSSDEEIDAIEKEIEEETPTPKITDVISKNNLQLIRDAMAQCQDLKELKALWQSDMKDYEERFLPSDYDKAVKSKDYFKNILKNRANQEQKG